MSNSSKAPLIQKVSALLKKKYPSAGHRESLPVLEHLVLAVLADGATTATTDAVFRRLKERYYDWNEVRVSAVAELQEALAELPNPEQRATRLKGCLKYIFESLYAFDLEQLRKLSRKDLAKRLSKMPGSSNYVIARVIRDGLGGSAMPLDSAAVRILTRLELIDSKTTPKVLGASLERLVPRSRSFEFCHLLSEHAAHSCTEADPHCKPCVLLDLCPTGQKRLAEMQAAAAAKRARAKAKRARSKAR